MVMMVVVADKMIVLYSRSGIGSTFGSWGEMIYASSRHKGGFIWAKLLLAESHYSRGAEVHQQRDQPRGCQGRLALRPAIFGFCMFFFSRAMWEEVGGGRH